MPWIQLFHYWQKAGELKVVLCPETTSIRDIVVAAQFKIMQCMLTNVIGISGLIVRWVLRIENILIHGKLPGKLKTVYSCAVLLLYIWADRSSPQASMLRVMCQNLCQLLPVFIKITSLPQRSSSWEQRKCISGSEQKSFYPSGLSYAIYTGCCWNNRRNSTSAIIMSIFAIMWESTSVCLKANFWLILPC